MAGAAKIVPFVLKELSTEPDDPLIEYMVPSKEPAYAVPSKPSVIPEDTSMLIDHNTVMSVVLNAITDEFKQGDTRTPVVKSRADGDLYPDPS